MTQPAHTPYGFDTVFSEGGAVVAPSSFRPIKRAYHPAEVEALVAQARLEAREQALAEIDSMRALAISAVGQAVGSAAPALAAVAQAHREQSAELALAAARVIAGAALDRFPAGPLKTAIETLSQEIEASPRLVIQAAGLDGEGQHQIETVCADAGYTGVVAFRDDPALAVAAFRLEWADGRAEFDPERVAARLTETLAAALAAEAGHAESLSDTRTDHGSAL